ncbi:AAA family ATPase [Gracilibacillus alcaliphilus]|uniref:AAA family ATPase n=1 Tax=Gracilibacillus alcaliphilus TaxID=1401441 RepID=UPI00195923AE|nr:AAA family ATPase [Gracilibacillus alcaliphilus]MBM7676548.1 MinD-like ATPase involved in chromosome partitioning or flagellar assembly [Gracilibacillus alcaliphilus]
MHKINLVLYTSDLSYAEYFSTYIRNPENGMRFSAKIYTDAEAFYKNVRNQKQHILLTDKSIEEEDSVNFDIVIRLADGQDFSHEEVSIFKYQPLKEVLSQILAIYFETNDKVSKLMTGKQKEKVISFYSGSAGSGKTLTSLCLAKYLAQQEKRTFYLSLESIHSTYLFFQEEKGSSVEVFYYLRNNVDKLVAKVESLKSTDSLTNIDYFSLPVSLEEMENITTEEVELLIQALKDSQSYDYIIIDLDASLHDRNQAAMRVSDEVVWVLSSDQTSFARSQYKLEQGVLDEQIDKNKLHFVLNKVGSHPFAGFNNYNFSIETHIPFQPQWLTANEQTKMLEDTFIGEKLFQSVAEDIDINMEVSLVEG